MSDEITSSCGCVFCDVDMPVVEYKGAMGHWAMRGGDSTGDPVFCFCEKVIRFKRPEKIFIEDSV